MTAGNPQVKKENKNSATNKIIDAVKIATPIAKGVDKRAGAMLDGAVKTKEHVDQSTVDSKAVAADIIAVSAPFVGMVSPNSAVALLVSAKSLKIKYKSTGNSTDNINTILQVASAVVPIINKLNPPVGASMEVMVNFAKLYNNSKLTSANQDLYTDLTAAIIPAIKLVNKKTGITMEVLVNASKTETGAEAIKSLKFKVSNFNKPLNKNEQLEADKKWKELPDSQESEWIVKIKAIHTKIAEEHQLEEFLIQGFSKVWELEKNPKENNKDLQKSIVENVLKAVQIPENNKVVQESLTPQEVEQFEDIDLVELEDCLVFLLQNHEVMPPLGESSALME